MQGQLWDFLGDSHRARMNCMRSLSPWAVVLLFMVMPLSLIGTILFSLSTGKSAYSGVALPKGYPESICTDVFEWPASVKIEGVGKVEEYAVAYTEHGYFAVFRDGTLHHMLFAPCDQSGIAGDRIYTVYNNTLSLYNADGKRVKETAADVLQREQTYSGEQTIAASYVYRVTHKGGYDYVTAEADGVQTTLLSHRYCNLTLLYRVLAVICGLLFASCLIFAIAKALPYRLEVLRKYDIID